MELSTIRVALLILKSSTSWLLSRVSCVLFLCFYCLLDHLHVMYGGLLFCGDFHFKPLSVFMNIWNSAVSSTPFCALHNRMNTGSSSWDTLTWFAMNFVKQISFRCKLVNGLRQVSRAEKLGFTMFYLRLVGSGIHMWNTEREAMEGMKPSGTWNAMDKTCDQPGSIASILHIPNA